MDIYANSDDDEMPDALPRAVAMRPRVQIIWFISAGGREDITWLHH